ncbi:RHS repeat domain-containing protein [Glaciecola sp. SC05]|uniref:RHS repeat domain-containing protein n=1 Tax=Glaciecola sp. SC05 TaxID=1987355 RepID=UPI003527092D
MNGRIYDPILGRFLQADPFIQGPKNSQSFNRYSYVLNNHFVSNEFKKSISPKAVLT